MYARHIYHPNFSTDSSIGACPLYTFFAVLTSRTAARVSKLRASGPQTGVSVVPTQEIVSKQCHTGKT